jgi:hypothetical protein
MADQATFAPDSMAYLKCVPLTSEMFAATCDAIAEYPLHPKLGLCFPQMIKELKILGRLPLEYVGDLYKPEWNSTPTLAKIFSPNYGKHITLPFSSLMKNFSTPPLVSELPTAHLPDAEYLNLAGPTFVTFAYAATGIVGDDLVESATNILMDVLDVLIFLRMRASAYLRHWLTDDRYMYPSGFRIPQAIVYGPGIFQSIRSSTGVATSALTEEVRAQCAVAEVQPDFSREIATAFVTALPTVELSAIPEDEIRCPHCWGNWDEASPPDVNHAVKKTPCGHLFGHDCLVKGLIGKPATCPMCRQELSRSQLRWRESNMPHTCWWDWAVLRSLICLNVVEICS